MKMKLVFLLSLFWCSTTFTDPNENLVKYLTQINESLIKVVNNPQGSTKQVAHLERAKSLVQEAIIIANITNNSVIYAIAGILLNDPVYAARAVELEKIKHSTRRDTTQLERREVAAEDSAEACRNKLEDQIEEEEMYLLFPDKLVPQDKELHENRLSSLKKTRSWIEAQCLAHGMLKEAIYMYKNSKDQENASGVQR